MGYIQHRHRVGVLQWPVAESDSYPDGGVVLISLTKAEIRQRRWVKQRISYLEDDVARMNEIVRKRLSVLEHLLVRDLPSESEQD